MFKRYLPILDWLPGYDRHVLVGDGRAALIVTLMLIPQALAYALLAGLPAVVGLYSSILPLLAYAIFGTSRSLAVGPMALIALMTATALGELAEPGSDAYIQAAITLTFMTGALLALMGLFRLGFLANFLSHPVISGLISASGIVIATSQLGILLGISSSGSNLVEQLSRAAGDLDSLHLPTLAIGLGSLALLQLFKHAGSTLKRLGLGAGRARFVTRLGPLAAVTTATLASWLGNLPTLGVDVIGRVEGHLPPLGLPSVEPALWQELWLPALLIAVVGFIESVALAQTLAARRRERIAPNQELIGLGAANVTSAFSSGMPVIGSLSRTVVNFDAGARTPAAGALTALGVAVSTFYLTPLLTFLPEAALAAIIIVSALALVDVKTLRRTWRYSRSDTAALLATLLLTLLQGIESGILAGLTLSIGLYLYRTSHPHSALVGRVPGTEHFRNVERHAVQSDQRIALLRIDGSLYFANARYLEDRVYDLITQHPRIEHVVLICSAINMIDASALESLASINARLRDSRVTLHLAEVKGPVMDRLQRVELLDALTGRVFFTTYDAWQTLTAGAVQP